MTNRYLARFAKRVMQAFPGTFEARFKAETCGNPVRADVVALEAPELRWRDRVGPPRVLVTGGSQGAFFLLFNLPAYTTELRAEDPTEASRSWQFRVFLDDREIGYHHGTTFQ